MELAQFVGNSLVQLADLVALRGYLALEQGDTQKAAELFRETLSYNVGTASRSAAEYYLAVIEAQRSK